MRALVSASSRRQQQTKHHSSSQTVLPELYGTRRSDLLLLLLLPPPPPLHSPAGETFWPAIIAAAATLHARAPAQRPLNPRLLLRNVLAQLPRIVLPLRCFGPRAAAATPLCLLARSPPPASEVPFAAFHRKALARGLPWDCECHSRG